MRSLCSINHTVSYTLESLFTPTCIMIQEHYYEWQARLRGHWGLGPPLRETCDRVLPLDQSRPRRHPVQARLYICLMLICAEHPSLIYPR
jgi:hypothetical protein